MQFYVLITGEVENPGADALSLTGVVNETPVSAMPRLSAINKSDDRRRAKQLALIGAYRTRTPRISPGAELVVMED